MYVYEEDAEPNLELHESRDGSAWEPAAVEAQHFASPERNYDYRVPVRYSYTPRDPSVRFFKASFSGSVDIVRVELDYR
jgi:hypothetical protein